MTPPRLKSPSHPPHVYMSHGVGEVLLVQVRQRLHGDGILWSGADDGAVHILEGAPGGIPKHHHVEYRVSDW